MNRGSRSAPFDDTLVPGADEVQAYDPKSGPCCTAERFRPDLNSPPGTPWNKSAARVFAQSFVDSDEFECDDVKLVREMFATHLIYLSRRYKRSRTSPEDQLKAQKLADRNERKRELYKRRLAAGLSYNDLKPHVQMLQRFGEHGMSSDESYDEDGITHYRVFVKSWRKAEVTPWLRAFDTAYRKLRKGPNNKRPPGAQVHWREVTTLKDDSRGARSHLPRAAYDNAWYENLPDMDKEDLCVTEEPYEFTHTDAILQ
ncbi:hypothetical protein C8T65DRAFT_598124 [Cerioporus squamosus]|nr:hypothetical protein C8T65DRAFT_598124 [Cerioporus squamosus]